jgi:hypothetical protein
MAPGTTRPWPQLTHNPIVSAVIEVGHPRDFAENMQGVAQGLLAVDSEKSLTLLFSANFVVTHFGN